MPNQFILPKRLKVNEDKLQAIAIEQGSNVATLVALVKENGETIQAMDVSNILTTRFFFTLISSLTCPLSQNATRATTLQGLFDVVLQADTDQSFTIGTKEVNMLLLRFKVDPRVTVNETKFREKVAAAGGDLLLSTLIQDLVNPDGSPEDHIFSIHSTAGMA